MPDTISHASSTGRSPVSGVLTRLLLLGVSATALSAAGPALAQQNPNVIEAIVVTAQKREQSLQDVSAAVSAIGAERLQSAQVDTLEDLQFLVPSITLGNDFNMAKIFIRGVGANTSTTGSETGVAFHVDGAVVARAEAQLTSLFDLERVEVVRGPQGTLYGRNAVGGSINLITAKPTEAFEGYGRVTYGNYDALTMEGAVSGTITDGIRSRLAFKSEDRGGYGENPVTGGDIDNLNRQMARLHVEFLPSDTVNFLLTGEWYHQDDASGAVKFRRESFIGDTLFPGLEALGEGGRATDPRDLASEFDPRTLTETWAVTGTLTWDATETITVTNLTNYRDFETSITQDLDVSAVRQSIDLNGNPTTVQRRDVVSQQFSNELRMNYSDTWLEGVLGAFYFRENQRPIDTVGLTPYLGMERNLDHIQTAPHILNPGPNQTMGGPVDLDHFLNLCDSAQYADGIDRDGPIPPKRVCTKSDLDTEAFALFGQVNIGLGAVSDSLSAFSLKLGGRYSWEERRSANPSIVIADGGTGAVLEWTTEGTRVKRSFDDFTPELGVEWQPDDRLLVYYTYSEGFKSGSGENAAGSTTIVDPETITNHEAGIKTAWFNNALTVNLAAYTYDLSGLQINKTISGGPTGYLTVFENAAETSAKGLELGFAAQPASIFRLSGALSYLDSEFDDFVTADPLNPNNVPHDLNPPPVSIESIQLAGNPTRNSPKWSGNLHAEFDVPGLNLPDQGFLTLAGDMIYRSDVYFTEFNRLLEGSDDYLMFDASLQYTSGDSALSAQLWVKNLTDEQVASSTFAMATARVIGVTYLPPRTYGVSVGYRF